MYVDDCVEGTVRLFAPISKRSTFGSSELVTINETVSICESFANVSPSGPTCSTLRRVSRAQQRQHEISATLGWEPSTRSPKGWKTTYRWIYDQMVSASPTSARLH